MKYIVLTGRIFFSIMFLNAIPFHFTQQAFAYAAGYGVPFPEILVPVSGIIAFTGGLSIATGFKAKAGAWLIVLFLIPVTFMMHAFWKETDPMQTQMQMSNFMKNVSMLGGALIIAYFGAGPLSFDARKKLKRKREAELNNILKAKAKEVQVEDTKDKIKVDAFSNTTDGLEFQHFLQNPDDPREVIFLFRAASIDHAKELIKRNSDQKKNSSLVTELLFGSLA